MLTYRGLFEKGVARGGGFPSGDGCELRRYG